MLLKEQHCNANLDDLTGNTILPVKYFYDTEQYKQTQRIEDKVGNCNHNTMIDKRLISLS